MAKPILDDLKNWKLWVGVFMLVFVVLFGMQALGLMPDPPPSPDEVLEGLDPPDPSPLAPPVIDIGGIEVVLESVCLRFDLEASGSASMSRLFSLASNVPERSIEDASSELLALVGIKAVNSDCTASFEVTVEGSWSGARYAGLGFCANDVDIDGEAVLRLPAGRLEWAEQRDARPPPQALTTCLHQSDDPILPAYWYYPLVVEPFIDLAGASTGAAARLLDLGQPTSPSPPDEPAIDMVIRLLRGDHYNEAVDLIDAWAREYPETAHLDSLVPYLIEAYATHPDDESFKSALSRITGQDMSDSGYPNKDWEPGDWYRWWLKASEAEL